MKPTKMHLEEQSKIALIFWIQNDSSFVGDLCVRVLDLRNSAWKRGIARIRDQS